MAITLSRWQLELFTKCPRCFWLLKRHNVKPPEGFPLALNTAMDGLLKEEFDTYRVKGQPHPILVEHRINAKLFADTTRLAAWRNTFQGLRWTDPETGHTLFGAVDDVLEFPDGSLAALDYKSSGAREARVYPSYQLQLDVYTFLLERLGHKTAPKAFLAFFLAVKDDGFNGRLPFRRQLLEVTAQPDRVPAIFEQAIHLTKSDQTPSPGAECDCCRWFGAASPIITRKE
ncbi:MAG: PD-(D/E)XK nuclease family protein [Candidatus Omnitrophica bacterium]|nr:PD-(D/E)XK nuclease family protein [Candidatus Omnitrophota bacterium]